MTREELEKEKVQLQGELIAFLQFGEYQVEAQEKINRLTEINKILKEMEEKAHE